jgi:hypothetical protein
LTVCWCLATRHFGSDREREVPSGKSGAKILPSLSLSLSLSLSSEEKVGKRKNPKASERERVDAEVCVSVSVPIYLCEKTTSVSLNYLKSVDTRELRFSFFSFLYCPSFFLLFTLLHLLIK